MDAFLPQVFSWVSENGMYLPNSHLSSRKWWLPNGSWGPHGSPIFRQSHRGSHWPGSFQCGMNVVFWLRCGIRSTLWRCVLDPRGMCRAGVVASAWEMDMFFHGELVGATIRGFPTWSNCAWKFHAHNFHNVSSSSHLTKMFQGLESLDGLPGWPERVELSPHPSLWRSWSGPLCSPCWALSSFLWHCDLGIPGIQIGSLPRGFWRGF